VTDYITKGVTKVTNRITTTKKGSLIHLKGNIPHEKRKEKGLTLEGRLLGIV